MAPGSITRYLPGQDMDPGSLHKIISGPTNVSSSPATNMFLTFELFGAPGIRPFWWASGGKIILHLVVASRATIRSNSGGITYGLDRS